MDTRPQSILTAEFTSRCLPMCARARIYRTTFAPIAPFTRGLEIGSPGSAWRFPLFCWPQLFGKEMFRAIAFRYQWIFWPRPFEWFQIRSRRVLPYDY